MPKSYGVWNAHGMKRSVVAENLNELKELGSSELNIADDVSVHLEDGTEINGDDDLRRYPDAPNFYLVTENDQRPWLSPSNARRDTLKTESTLSLVSTKNVVHTSKVTEDAFLSENSNIKEVSSLKDHKVQRYAKDVFSETLLTGVPSVVKAPNWSSRIFRICTLLACFLGCTYMLFDFISHFLTYPTTVDVEMKSPQNMPAPAFTICDNNGIPRSAFCKVYEEKCENLTNQNDFCRRNPQACSRIQDWKNFMIPKAEYDDFDENATVGDFKLLRKDTFVRVYYLAEDRVLINKRTEGDVEGVYVLFKDNSRGSACYTVNSAVKRGLIPRNISLNDDVRDKSDTIMSVVILLDRTESFGPRRTVGAWLSLHSPFETSNPLQNGHFLEYGKEYEISFNLEVNELLPHPYPTNCWNYITEWLEHGRTGPTSKMVCKEMCLREIYKKRCHNCSSKSLDFLEDDEKACFSEKESCVIQISKNEVDGCSAVCKDDCITYRYTSTIEEKLQDPRFLSPYTTVQVRLKTKVIAVMKHRPHYRDHDLISFIGGYAGAWLGISLFALIDFLENVFQLCAFVLVNRQKKVNEKTKAVNYSSACKCCCSFSFLKNRLRLGNSQ